MLQVQLLALLKEGLLQLMGLSAWKASHCPVLSSRVHAAFLCPLLDTRLSARTLLVTTAFLEGKPWTCDNPCKCRSTMRSSLGQLQCSRSSVISLWEKVPDCIVRN